MVYDDARAKIAEAVARLQRGLHPRAIYLFGSHAYGQPHEDSDVDLLVVVDTLDEPSYEMEARAYRMLSGLAFPIEIQIVSQDEYDERRTWLNSVERDVHERGVQLYAAA